MGRGGCLMGWLFRELWGGFGVWFGLVLSFGVWSGRERFRWIAGV